MLDVLELIQECAMSQVDYMEIELPVTKLEIGMHVVALDRPWSETTFLMQGFVISHENELIRIQNQCQYVVARVRSAVGRQLQKSCAVELARIKRNHLNRASIVSVTDPRVLRKQMYRNKIGFDQGVSQSAVTFQQARLLAEKIMESAKAGRSINLNECRKTVTKVVESVLQNSDALRFLTQIKNINKYTVEHSMNCCVFAATFAKHLGLAIQDIEKVAFSALMHDIGKSKIPLEILNKKTKLSREEAMLMARHAEFGWRILMAIPNKSEFIAEVAYGHHEREDGLGYPRHLHDLEISLFTKIVTIVDCYDAMTSRRCYGNVHTSSESLEIIKANAGTQFDSGLAYEFVKCIGEYPPGSLVEMTNGEIGIVISSSDEYGQYPRVLIVRDSQQHEMVNNHIVDIRSGEVDRNNMPYEISTELPNGSFGVNLDRHFDVLPAIAI